MSLARYSAREMRQRPGRTVLTLLGIVIGVAAIVSIGLSLATTRAAYHNLFTTIGGRAALEVTAAGRSGFDPGVATDLGTVPGVRSAVPLVSAYAAFTTPSGAVPVAVLGIDPARDGAVRDYAVSAGAMLGDGDGALLPADFAADHGVPLGGTVRLVTPSGPAELGVTGLLSPQGAAAAFRGAVVFTTIPTAQRMFALTDRINAVQVVLADGADAETVRAAVASRLPTGLSVQPTTARSRIIAQTNLSSELALSVLSVVSLAAGGFVILNAFLMSVSERRRNLAILRALGATRRQVMTLLLRESLLLGVVGTIVGTVLGVGASLVLNHVLESMMQAPRLEFFLTPLPLVLAGVLGPGVALAATAIPALAASRRPPLEALFDAREVRGERVHRWPGYVGLVLILLVVLLLAALVNEWLPLSVTYMLLPVGMSLIVVSMALVIPLTVEPLRRALAGPFRRLLGMEGTLALRQLARHPTRTHLTVCVLGVSMVVAVGFGSSLRNSAHDVQHWASRIGAVDFLVRSFMSDPALIMAGGMPAQAVDDIAKLDGVDLAAVAHFGFAEVGGEQVLLVARSIPAGWPLQIDVVDGDPAAVHERMRQGEIVIGTLLAQRTGLGVGDEIVLATRAGPARLRIAATSTEYSGGGLLVQLEWETARRLLGVEQAHVMFLTAKPGQQEAVGRELAAYCAAHDLQFESQAAFRAMVDQAMSGVIASLWGLLGLGFLVASLGIANTLTMNVLEQTREIGLLRAVAMTRGQLFRTIVAQAAAMGLVSLPSGAIAGVAFGWAMNVSTYPLNGFRIEFAVEPWHVIGCAVIAFVVALLGATPPARRAAGMSVIRALQYE